MRSTSGSGIDDPEHRGDFRPAQPKRAGFDTLRVLVQHIAACAARPNLFYQGDRSSHCGDRQFGVGAAFEAHTGFRLESKLLARAPDGSRIEIRAFEDDGRRRVRDLGFGAPHDSCHGDRTLGVGNDKHVGRKYSLLTIECLKRFAGPRRSHANVRPGQSREIKCVHRMAHLEQHIVGDVDDIADRPDAGRVQARLHPSRRGTDRSGGNRSDVAGTEVRGLNDDLEIGRSASGRPIAKGHGGRSFAATRRAIAGREVGSIRRQEWQPVCDRNLARDPDDRHAIGSVRSHLEVNHRIAAGGRTNVFDTFDGEAAHRHRPRNGLRDVWYCHELPQPRQQDLHSGNCSRKRRSFS